MLAYEEVFHDCLCDVGLTDLNPVVHSNSLVIFVIKGQQVADNKAELNRLLSLGSAGFEDLDKVEFRQPH